MFHDIMVPIVTPGSALPALDAALDLMRHGGGHLTVARLVDLPYPVGGTWSMGPDPRLFGLYDALRRDAAEDVARIEDSLRRAGVDHEVKLVECRELIAEDAAIVHALHADLVVAGTGGDARAREIVVALLLRSGRPVMFVPAGVPPPLPPTRIVLAWKPAREATRAMHDAMALLKAAERVDVVLVDMPEDADGGDGTRPLLAHLQRHEVRAEVVHLESRGASIGTVLQQHARQSGAQLIVAGAYGHSRLREWVLGGATRELLLLPGVPVLFSH